MAKRLALLLTAGLSLALHAAQAQSLSDPTRPPNVSATAPADGAPRAAAAQRLESILISPNRRVAVIDGRTVTEGSRIDEGTVVQIAETYVTLRKDAELKKLELYPGIVRKSVPEKKERSQP
jgi:MSHA biogenesis protein MshK